MALLPLDFKDDFSGDPVCDDPVMFDHAIHFAHSEQHDATQSLRGFDDGATTRIVKADLGLHGDVDIAYD
jgi:hypothetical protein